MFSDLSQRLPSVPLSWLPPVVDRLNSPHSHHAWPAPSLAPLDLPAPLRERLLAGLLAACKQRLQHGHILPDDTASVESLVIWSNQNEPAWFSEAALARHSAMWLAWLEEMEVRLALRVLLAPISAFGVVQPWRAAVARQAALAKRLARIAALHDALTRLRGSDHAFRALDRALAALAAAET